MCHVKLPKVYDIFHGKAIQNNRYVMTNYLEYSTIIYVKTSYLDKQTTMFVMTRYIDYQTTIYVMLYNIFDEELPRIYDIFHEKLPRITDMS